MSSFGLVVDPGHGFGDGFGERLEVLRRSIFETRFKVLVEECHTNAEVSCCWGKQEGGMGGKGRYGKVWEEEKWEGIGGGGKGGMGRWGRGGVEGEEAAWDEGEGLERRGRGGIGRR